MLETKTNYDMVTLGELLVDFTQAGFSGAGMRLFEQNAGGAVANVVCALARLGKKTAFIGKVGQDMHGAFLRSTLEACGVDTQGLSEDRDAFTTLAFVELSESGERRFSFARKPGADTRLAPEDLTEDLLVDTRIFHYGSLSLTDEPARSATWRAIRVARSGGALISYDPNYRASLWPGEAEAVKWMREGLRLANCVKLSEEEAVLLSGETKLSKAAAHFLKLGPSCVVVTQGERGAAAFLRGRGASVVTVQAQAVPVQAVDTTGAGDAFWGAFLYRLLEEGAFPEELDKDRLAGALRFANAAASLVVQRRGGIPAMPTLEEIQV